MGTSPCEKFSVAFSTGIQKINKSTNLCMVRYTWKISIASHAQWGSRSRLMELISVQTPPSDCSRHSVTSDHWKSEYNLEIVEDIRLMSIDHARSLCRIHGSVMSGWIRPLAIKINNWTISTAEENTHNLWTVIIVTRREMNANGKLFSGNWVMMLFSVCDVTSASWS